MLIDNTTKVNLSQTKKGDVVFAVIGSTKNGTYEMVHGTITDYAVRSVDGTNYAFLDAIVDTGNGRIVQSNRIYMINPQSVANLESEKEESVDDELTLLDVYPQHDTLLATLDREWIKYMFTYRVHMTKNERIAWQIDYKRRKDAAIKRAMARVAEFMDLVATINMEHPFETA